jgi:hypothetical protein
MNDKTTSYQNWNFGTHIGSIYPNWRVILDTKTRNEKIFLKVILRHKSNEELKHNNNSKIQECINNSNIPEPTANSNNLECTNNPNLLFWDFFFSFRFVVSYTTMKGNMNKSEVEKKN